MKRGLVIIFSVLLIVGTIGCTPSQSQQQLAKIETQIQTLTAALASTQQELSSAKQALSEAQDENRLLQQPPTVTNGEGVTPALPMIAVPATNVPVITSFIANPTAITVGQPSTLQWNITGAGSVSIYPGIGAVSYTGTQVVYPTVSTTYILTTTNSYGSVTASATVTVISGAYSSPSYPYYSDYPLITSFIANPTAITVGQPSTLQWNITGAGSVSIYPGIGAVSYTGTQVVYPTVSTTYILTTTNSYGSVTASATVTVISGAYSSPSYPYYSDYPYYIYRYYIYRHYHPFTYNRTSPHPPFPHH